jgi:peptidoglycan/xylan/chitin deacetylase (PgdA/CDA1 family)
LKLDSLSAKIDTQFIDIDTKRPTIVSALKKRLRAALRNGPLAFIRDHYAGLGSCLLYHRVSSDNRSLDAFSPYSGLSVTKEVFEIQVEFLKKNYNCVSLPYALDLLTKGELTPKTVVLTFDDGYKNNLDVALPILEKYEVPATIYLTSGLIDRTAELWWFEQEKIIKNSSKLDFSWKDLVIKTPLYTQEEKFEAIVRFNNLFRGYTLTDQREFMKVMRAQYGKEYSIENEILNWEEAKKLDEHPLITLGAHTKNHAMLSKLEPEELKSELTESKIRLEEMLGHEIAHLAYPFGAKGEVGQREFKATRECGYKSAVTTRQGHFYPQHRDYIHILPRISINNDDLLDSLTWKLSGLYSMFHHRGKRFSVA